MIFWEPSHENDLQYVFEGYYSESCKRPTTRENVSQLKFALNQDPEMEEVYLKGINRTLLGTRHVFEQRSSPSLEYYQDQDVLVMAFAEGGQSYLQVVDRATLQVYQLLTLDANVSRIKMEGVFLLVDSDSLLVYLFDNKQLVLYRSVPKLENYISSDIFYVGENIQMMQLVSTSYEITFFWQQIDGKNVSSQSVGLHVYYAPDLWARDFEVLAGQGFFLYNKVSNKRRQFSATFAFTFLNDKLGVTASEGLGFLAFGEFPVVKLYSSPAGEAFILAVISRSLLLRRGEREEAGCRKDDSTARGKYILPL